MGVLAQQLARMVLEGESPRDVIKRIAKELPVAGWDDWDDLEEWQQQAAREAQARLQERLELDSYDNQTMKVKPAGADYTEYTIYQDYDVMESEAVDRVKEDLENEPELFTQSWLMGYINTEKLDNTLWPDYREHYLEQSQESEEDWATFLVEQGELDEDDLYTEDEDGDQVPVDNFSELVEEAKDKWIDDQEEGFDGMDHLEQIYGEKDAGKQAVKLVGIDVEAAAKDAVNTDGPAHFLNHYDGNYDELPSGAILMRVN